MYACIRPLQSPYIPSLRVFILPFHYTPDIAVFLKHLEDSKLGCYETLFVNYDELELRTIHSMSADVCIGWPAWLYRGLHVLEVRAAFAERERYRKEADLDKIDRPMKRVAEILTQLHQALSLGNAFGQGDPLLVDNELDTLVKQLQTAR